MGYPRLLFNPALKGARVVGDQFRETIKARL